MEKTIFNAEVCRLIHLVYSVPPGEMTMENICDFYNSRDKLVKYYLSWMATQKHRMDGGMACSLLELYSCHLF